MHPDEGEDEGEGRGREGAAGSVIALRVSNLPGGSSRWLVVSMRAAAASGSECIQGCILICARDRERERENTAAPNPLRLAWHLRLRTNDDRNGTRTRG